ncbi:hypothetical protein RAA17_13700 [Komagataeibacter rhaeticus]|nr:hypothetical protein [Komagataeibacter rhaeticus]
MSGIFNDVMGKLSDLAGSTGLSQQVHSYLSQLLTPATITSCWRRRTRPGWATRYGHGSVTATTCPSPPMNCAAC